MKDIMKIPRSQKSIHPEKDHIKTINFINVDEIQNQNNNEIPECIEIDKIEEFDSNTTTKYDSNEENNDMYKTIVVNQPHHKSNIQYKTIINNKGKSENQVKFYDQANCQIQRDIVTTSSAIDVLPHAIDNTVIPLQKQLVDTQFKLFEGEGELLLFKKPDDLTNFFVNMLRVISVILISFSIIGAILGNWIIPMLGLASLFSLQLACTNQSTKIFSKGHIHEQYYVRLTQDEAGIRMQINVKTSFSDQHIEKTNIQKCVIRNVKNSDLQVDPNNIEFIEEIPIEGNEVILLVDDKNNYQGILEQVQSNRFVQDYISAQIEKQGKFH